MGVVFLVIALLVLLKSKHAISALIIVSVFFFITGFFAPALLKPVYIFWMSLAFVLGWLNSRLILFIMFYLIFAPVGLLMRLFAIDPLDKKIQKEKTSYWKTKEKKDTAACDYERQF